MSWATPRPAPGRYRSAGAPPPGVRTRCQRAAQTLRTVTPPASRDGLPARAVAGPGGCLLGAPPRGDPGHQGSELDVVGGAAQHAHVGGHRGMFPCFLAGSAARLVRSARSARTTCTRVSDGAITASTYSPTRRARSASASPPASATVLRAPRCRMFTAPPAPITAICAVGHARLTSAPSCLEPITMYAPPYALRVITVTSGTVASAYA